MTLAERVRANLEKAWGSAYAAVDIRLVNEVVALETQRDALARLWAWLLACGHGDIDSWEMWDVARKCGLAVREPYAPEGRHATLDLDGDPEPGDPIFVTSPLGEMLQRHGAALEEAHPVYCLTCGLRKKPLGRDAAPAMANSLCDHECPGYREAPHPGTRWPGEEAIR